MQSALPAQSHLGGPRCVSSDSNPAAPERPTPALPAPPSLRPWRAHWPHAGQARETGAVGTIVALLPAHNEAESIGTTLSALAAQTRVPDVVVVICDNCTD